MKRTFQAKTTLYQYVLLAALLSVAVCLLWIPMPQPVLGALMAALFFLMFKIISAMVATFYVIYTEGYMEIKKGTLPNNEIRIQLSDIKQIDRMRRRGTLVIVTNDGKEHFIIPPKNEEDFIRCIEKYRS